METKYVLLREFIYGYDFTESDDNDNTIIYNTAEEVQAEIDDEIDAYKNGELHIDNLDDAGDDLIIANVIITDDGYLIAIDNLGHEIVRSEQPNKYALNN